MMPNANWGIKIPMVFIKILSLFPRNYALRHGLNVPPILLFGIKRVNSCPFVLLRLPAAKTCRTSAYPAIFFPFFFPLAKIVLVPVSWHASWIYQANWPTFRFKIRGPKHAWLTAYARYFICPIYWASALFTHSCESLKTAVPCGDQVRMPLTANTFFQAFPGILSFCWK